MIDTRDNFSAKIRKTLAERAGQRCSFCKIPTVGPSDESPTAIMSIGVAAHITAASGGRGSRRYDANQSSEERSGINNGIWLCQSCSVIIDRDEIRFSSDVLKAMKREHEEFSRLGAKSFGDVGIIGIGPHITAAGHLISVGPNGMQFRVAFFLEGSAPKLLAFVHEFETIPPLERHTLLSEIGIGGILSEPPTITRDTNAYILEFDWKKSPLRLDASKPIKGMCRETGGWLSGIDYHIQTFENAISEARGTWFTNIDGGSHISEMYWRFKESAWYDQLIKAELIRLASVPNPKRLGSKGEEYTRLLCVNRVNDVKIPNYDLDDRQRLLINVDFELEGHGNWTGDLRIYIYTLDGLEKERAKAIWMKENIRRGESGERMLPTPIPPEDWQVADGFPSIVE